MVSSFAHPDARASPGSTRDTGESGFALVIVLWIAALLALAATALGLSSRTHISISRNAVAADRAEMLADAGLMLVMRDLMRGGGQAGAAGLDAGRPGPARFVPGAAAVACRLPDGELLLLTLADEGGKVDLNQASPELLRALFVGLELPEARARAAADAIADFRDADDTRRPDGAEADDYRAAGSSGGPKNAAFASIAELAFVLGIDDRLAARLAPFVTVHSASSGIDARQAPAGLVDILARGGEASGNTTTLARQADGADRLPAAFASPATGRAFTIVAEVTLPSGLRMARQALVVVQRGAARASDLERAQRDPSITRLRQLPGADASGARVVLRPMAWTRIAPGTQPSDQDTGVSGDAVADLPPC